MDMELSYLRLSTIVLSIFGGVLLSVLARHMRIPAIAPLLLGGVLLGPEVFGVIDTKSLGEGLRLIISLSVATILFEGGLTLEFKGVKKVGGVILKMLTLGVLVTWLGTAFFTYYLFDFSISMSLLAGSLIIVTGPTVITPLLNRVKVKENLHHILHWEGVLIDPIGVFIAILCFEWHSVSSTPLEPLTHFGLRVVVGVVVGLIGGLGTYWLLKKDWIPEQQANIFVLAMALFLFGISDLFVHESGILTVVVAGFSLGWKKPTQLRHIQKFKSELTEMAIAILFVLLSANLLLENFLELGIVGVILIALVMFVIRPLNVVVSTIGSTLSLREKLFLSWIAPRGVVSGSMASLFAIQLSRSGEANAAFLEAFTFSIIGITVLFQGLFSGVVARVLKVKAPPKQGWLIVGAHYFSRKIAKFIQLSIGSKCVLIDSNDDAVREAQKEGFTAVQGNATAIETIPDEVFTATGNILALTDNRALNQLICEKWSEHLSRDHLYRWSSKPDEEDNSRAMGTIIWQNLSNPSRIAYDLRNKEATLIRTKTDRAASKILPGTVPLIAQQNGLTALNSFDWNSEGEALLYQQLSSNLPFYVHLDHIIDMETDSIGTLLETALEQACNIHPEIPYDETFKTLQTRQKNFPTLLGNGVSVPHTHCSALKEPVCLIVRNPQGIIMNGDHEPSRLFFVTLSPAADPELHLILLADIAKIASDEELIERLFKTPEAEKVIDLLREV